jgi:O-antigen/teichoic acid export membrane protein
MTVIRRSIIFTAAQAGLLFVGLASSIAVSRVLGPDGRGIVALVSVLIATSTALATFGFGTSFAYLAGKNLHPLDQIVGNSVVAAFGLGALTILVLVACSDLLLGSVLRGMSGLEYEVTLASVPFAYLAVFQLNFLVGAGEAQRASVMQLCSGVFAAALITAALLLGNQGVTGVITTIAVVAVVVALWYLAIVVRMYGISFAGSGTIGKAAARFGAKVYLGTISGQFWLRADLLVLNLYAGPSAVGQYSLATSLAEKIWILDSSVAQVTLHDVIGSAAREAGLIVAKTSRNVLFLAAGGCVALAVVAPWLVPALFGEEFSAAVGPLWLLLPGVLAIAVARPISSYFYGQMGRPQITSAVSILTAVVGIAAYLILVPPFGAAGAALGSSIAYIVPVIAYVPLFRRATGLTARETFLINREDLAMYSRLLRTMLGHLGFTSSSPAK